MTPVEVDVVLVIVTYNSAHVITGLLDSVSPALDGLRTETIVVDNASQDETVDILRTRNDCRVIAAPNLGYAAGINRGAAAAIDRSAPILALNPDLTLKPGAVRALLEQLSDRRVGIVAPQVLDADGRTTWSARREPTLARALGLSFTGLAVFSEYVTDPEFYASARQVDWALGAALLMRRECFDRLRGWDESFFLYSEETDFCLRARDAGWLTRYTPQSVMTHIGGQSGTNDQIHSMQILNRVRLFRRRHSLLAAVAYYLLTIASELSWIVRGHQESRASVSGLLLPRSRPRQLGATRSLIPR